MGALVRYGTHQAPAPGSACLLCGEASPSPATDHCHRHGWVRGVLCPRCNSNMAYVDRGVRPDAFLAQGTVTLAAMIEHAHRCTDCSDADIADFGKQDNRMPHDGVLRFRAPDELWAAYSEIVGDGGRSADLKAYIEWRVDNPTTPLPGRRRGPVKKVRPPKPPAE